MSATPGPWAIDWNVSRLDIYGGDERTLVASLRRSALSPEVDEAARANARLIAAAPDLADALFGLLAAVGEIGLTQAQIEAMGKACEAASQALIKSRRVTG